ncbi:MAG: hypothetical protein K1W20_13030 [Lachnospiraceae bacterium]|nr:hypothetical protein [Lachnospiraceae bacterium]
MKKMLALTLAGVMAVSMPVMAATSPTADSYSTASPSSAATVSAVTASGVSHSVAKAAAEENKTVGEYMNNAVTEVPGISSVVPLGQGGHVIINGVPSNQTFSVLKPIAENVNLAKAQAAALGGTVLNVAQISASVTGFNTATVNFYLQGIRTGQNIKVYQLVNGQWVELTVTEIRDDHIVVDMTSLGTLAFIEVPAV